MQQVREAYWAGVAKEEARQERLQAEGRLLPVRWKDRPQHHALGCVIFRYATRLLYGVTIDFGRPGNPNIAIISDPREPTCHEER